MAASGSKRVVYAALAWNLLISVCKFVAAGFTGSSAMLSEGVHSLVDSGNQGLILLGMRRAAKKPDKTHPFGYGMELYFWTFVVAILIFAVGSGISIYEGLQRIQRPHPIEQPIWNYAVLLLSMIFEGYAWAVAFKEFRRTQGKRNWFAAVRHSKDPTVFTVLFEDSAAMVGLVIAFGGVAGTHLLEMPILDGIASIGIGIVLAVVALLLAVESKGLLIGEGADQEVIDGIELMVTRDRRIDRVNEILTMHLGPNDILVTASLDFADGLRGRDIEETITSFERRIKRAYPAVSRVFIEAQSWRSHEETSIETD